MAEPIRVLHVFGNLDLGGAESRIMDLYRHIDRERVQFDFLVHTEKECFFDKEVKELGGCIYRIPRFRVYNYFQYKKALKRFFDEHHDYKVVQGHMTSTAAIYLPIAKKTGVFSVAAHARSAGTDKGIKGTLTRILRKSLPQKTDYMFTCSEIAGISVFGEKAVEEGKTIFIPNAIQCDSFAYDEKKREKLRKELGLTDCYVIGHVGRFHYAKNHEYLIKVFADLAKTDASERYKLLLLGEGEGMAQAKELAKQLKIADDVIFAGNKSNVYDYYQTMDFFVYPSRYEGLPGTVVEAQASGLPCLISDRICREVAITDLVEYMSIDIAPQEWADYIVAAKKYCRISPIEALQKAGFDVNTQAERMMKFYETGIWK